MFFNREYKKGANSILLFGRFDQLRKILYTFLIENVEYFSAESVYKHKQLVYKWNQIV